MKYRKVKKINRDISILGLGCWAFSGKEVWQDCVDSESLKVIEVAIDNGINYFDVAPVYGFGHAETILGKGLRHVEREKVIIGTKCGLIWDDNKHITNCLKKNSIEKEIDESLKRLGVEYIDIYQLHWPDPHTDLLETIETLKKIKEKGKFLHLGVTNFSVGAVMQIMQYEDVVSQQGLYNMIERNADYYHNIPLEYRTEKEILPMCRKYGQAFFPYSPLFQGLLTGTFQSENNFSGDDIRSANPKLSPSQITKYLQIVDQLQALGDDMGHPLNEIACNWLYAKPEVTSVIAGALNVEQLEQNLRFLDWELDQASLDDINKVLAPIDR